jgi:hypothetical protein
MVLERLLTKTAFFDILLPFSPLHVAFHLVLLPVQEIVSAPCAMRPQGLEFEGEY